MYLARLLGIALVALLLALAPRCPAAEAEPSTWHLVYVRALPGQRERLAAFIEANWLVRDQAAYAAGSIAGFEWLEATESDAGWDFLVITQYPPTPSAPQSDGFVPSPRKVLIDGLDFDQLGEIVASELLRRRVGTKPPTASSRHADLDRPPPPSG